MNTWLERLRVWRLRRQQHSLERWSRVREKGKVRYVIQTALRYGLLMLAVITVFDYFESRIQFPGFLYKAIYYILVGVLIGFVSWWTMEGRYRNAKLAARIKAGMQ